MLLYCGAVVITLFVQRLSCRKCRSKCFTTKELCAPSPSPEKRKEWTQNLLLLWFLLSLFSCWCYFSVDRSARFFFCAAMLVPARNIKCIISCSSTKDFFETFLYHIVSHLLWKIKSDEVSKDRKKKKLSDLCKNLSQQTIRISITLQCIYKYLHVWLEIKHWLLQFIERSFHSLCFRRWWIQKLLCVAIESFSQPENW